MKRRIFLKKSSAVAVGAGLLSVGACSNIESTGSGPKTIIDDANLRFNDPEWNRDTYAKVQGNLNFGEKKLGWYRGKVMGVRPGERVKNLFGFEGFSYSRLVDNGDGSYQKLLREVGYYTDLETGEVLEEYLNPYTNEMVKVVHIANDPFNFVISPYARTLPAYGGLMDAKTPKTPLQYPWREAGKDQVTMTRDIHLYYPSALQPDKWPRESSGPMNQVSETFSYVFDKADLANPNLTTIDYSGVWSRVTPWLPWMLMGQAEGHAAYHCEMGAFKDHNPVSPNILAYAAEHHPKYFDAPDVWEEPSLSSLEHYALEQEPAPLLK